MSTSLTDLLKARRFLPLFVTQFLGAMNDNLFKQALVVLVAFRLAQESGMDSQMLVTVAAAVFILPFFLFSATAGQLADKHEKSRCMRWLKVVEIVVMLGAAAAFALESPEILLAVLFLMGAQSAFFGPLKYGILPDHLPDHELVAGNALIEGATFLAILFGTIIGGLIVLQPDGVGTVSILVVALAVLGWLASTQIPRAEPAAPELRVNPNFVGETWTIIRDAARSRAVFLSMLGISWFWLVGATFLAQMPNLTKNVLGADETVITLFMTVFSVGIGAGSLLCTRLLKGEISAKLVPFGALGLTLFTVDLYFALQGVRPGGEIVGASAFVTQAANWRILIDLFLVSASGGLYSVPLYAIVQHHSDPASRSRTIAANNILNALFVVGGAAVATGMLAAGMTVPHILLVVAAVNLLVAAYIIRLVPEGLVKALAVSILKLLYRVEVRGLEHYKDAGPRAVIVVNHVSYLDALLLVAFLPVKPVFAINTVVANKWWIRPLLVLAEAYPIDPANPMAMKSLVKLARQDRHCVIFPEGRITVTGALMKIYEGPGLIADKSDAMLVPIRIDGAQFTPFSRLEGVLRQRLFPKITITILPPRKFEIPADVVGRARRVAASAKLYDIMADMMFRTCNTAQTLFEALIDARAVHGGRRPVFEDIDRAPLSYTRLVVGAHVLGRKLAGMTRPKEFVGVMLPNSLGTAVTFFGLQAYARVPAMLNFSTGAKNMVSAIQAAEIKTVLTSRRFVEAAKLEGAVIELARAAEIVYLEDIRTRIGLGDRLLGFASLLGPARKLRALGAKPHDPAVVLFTSGSEGTPKGVVLSHENLLSNRYQLAARIDFNPTDIVFNALPIFHSFGLTGGMLLPALSGIKSFLYPSPLHYRIVPALVYDSNATIIFGTDTFLNGYGRKANPYDFYSVRYVFAGAEKVRDETRRSWSDKFGIRILEGYGATETAPVLAVNTPMHFKAGTVGRFLPGIDYRLDPVPGIEDGGRLVVAGPNVMLGYLRAERPGAIEPPDDGRYDTGDIVSVSDGGFVTILGRAKRFAKIAGEMVSLSAVEGNAAALWPDSMHAVVSIADPRRGEQLVLLTDKPGARRDELLAYAQQRGVAEIMVPKAIKVVERIPVLGTGKIDYVRALEIVREAVA